MHAVLTHPIHLLIELNFVDFNIVPKFLFSHFDMIFFTTTVALVLFNFTLCAIFESEKQLFSKGTK
jgi:hypothetical protein